MFRLANPYCFLARDAGDSPQASAPEQAAPDAQATPAVDEALTETLLKAVQDRSARAEKSVLHSMAEQSGVDEQTLTALLAQTRADNAAELSPEAQQRLDEANARVTQRLLMAEVKSVGAELGLIDADAALRLMDTAGVTITPEDGVTGVREVLEALRESKRYLFAPGGRGAWAQRVSDGGTAALSGVEEAFYRKNPNLRK
ncbi:MAG TPA: hypothetical protein PLP25_01555 [Candidatus Limiplasma sp.]|nr:hypothetical protein [Candidatus Limiplasma sp.]HPS80531.1 hypothetical protein [Candidatus Limiplasma sp.]